MVDYALKDYETIFNFLTEQATELSNGQWTDFTDGDFGTIIIHLLSYWGDLLSNQLDLTASELFMGTAEERTSLMEIVKLIGYEPASYQSSMASLYFTYDSDPNIPYEVTTLPAFSKFMSNSGLTYYNLYPVRLTSGTTVVPTYEGTLTSISFQYSDISTDGKILINDANLATNTVLMTIVSGVVSGEVERVDDVRFTTGELCFSVHIDLDGYPYIQLPAWWSSLISDPVTISVTYLKTKGIDGRVGANTIYRLVSDTTIASRYDITNPEASVGGTNPETVTEIKAKASAYARTMYTAVTLKDFEELSLFSDTIAQVRALDYNHGKDEFPPTISAYKQPTPPNGVPNDAYKVLIMAVPMDFSSSSIFTGEEVTYYVEDEERKKPNYGALTSDMKQLHDIYMDRKSATLYVEYRDPVYIKPWLIMNIYLKNKDDIRSGDVADSVRDFLRLRYARNRVSIGQSIYGSQIGREVLSAYNYIDYIEIRDPEYNIEAKPYEFVDMYNGYFMTWVDDELMTVPSGLNLVKMKKGDEIMLNTGTDGKAKNTSIMWISKDKYTQNTQYIPKSYQYDWDKKEGKYPRPQMEQIGVYWDENSTLTMIVPDSMYILSGTQTFDIKKGEYYHLFTSTRAISELASYISEEAILLPSFCTYEVSSDKSKIEVELSTEYSYVKVSKHEVSKGKKITITYPSDDTYIFENSGDAQVNRSELAPDVYYDIESDSCTFYVPEGWKVQVDSI